MSQFQEGKTVKIILSGCKCGELRSQSAIERYLFDICHNIGMTPISEPLSIRFYDEEDSLKDGVSGFVFIAESHVAIHTWPEYDAIRIIIDSCKEFNEDDLLDILLVAFDPEDEVQIAIS